MTRHNTFDLAVAAVIVVLLARGGPASAAIIDQQNGPGNTSFNGSAGFNWEQGVTAGITGQLVGVDIWDNSATSTTLTINRGAPWQSDANDFSQTISTTPGTWTHVDLSSANLQFTAGDQFSIGLIGLFPSSFNGSSVVDQYSGGTLWLNNAVPNSIWDMSFRTYVEPAQSAAVPEPASLAIWAGIGIGSVLIGQRRSLKTRSLAT